MTTREDIVAAARARVGVTWAHQGRSEEGIDCVGLITTVAHQLGLSTFDMTDYARMPDGIELITLLRSQMPEIHPKDRFGLGDVLVFHVSGLPTHVGIVGDYAWGGFSIIHAFNAVGKVVEQRLDNVLWLPRVVAAFRLLDAKR